MKVKGRNVRQSTIMTSERRIANPPMDILCYTNGILIALVKIHNAFRQISLLISVQITHEPLGGQRRIVDRRAAVVRADEDIRHRPEGMIRGERLDCKDVQAGAAQSAASQYLNQGSFLYDWPARHVDDDAP